MNAKFGQRIELTIIIIVTSYFIFLIGHDIIQFINFSKKSHDLKLSLSEQEGISIRFQEEFQKLHTNSYLEYLARLRLRYVKIGETAYKIIP